MYRRLGLQRSELTTFLLRFRKFQYSLFVTGLPVAAVEARIYRGGLAGARCRRSTNLREERAQAAHKSGSSSALLQSVRHQSRCKLQAKKMASKAPVNRASGAKKRRVPKTCLPANRQECTVMNLGQVITRLYDQFGIQLWVKSSWHVCT